MKRLTLLLALTAFSSSRAETQPDVSLYQRALSDDAKYEMHCRGMMMEDAEQGFDRTYKARQDRIRARLSEQYLLKVVEPDREIIPIGFKCPHYHGAEARLRFALRQAERRLGIDR